VATDLYSDELKVRPVPDDKQGNENGCCRTGGEARTHSPPKGLALGEKGFPSRFLLTKKREWCRLTTTGLKVQEGEKGKKAVWSFAI